MNSGSPSRWPTAARSIVGTSCTASLGQAARRQLVGQDAVQGAIRVDRLLAAAEDRRVAALDAERGGVDRDVGPALVDHEDHAQRHADLAHVQAVGPAARADDLADRVGQGGDLEQRLRPSRRSASGSSVSRSMAAAFSPKPGAAATSRALAARISSDRGSNGLGRRAQPGVLRRAGQRQLPARRPGLRLARLAAERCQRSIRVVLRSTLGLVRQFTGSWLPSSHSPHPRIAVQTLIASTIAATSCTRTTRAPPTHAASDETTDATRPLRHASARSSCPATLFATCRSRPHNPGWQIAAGSARVSRLCSIVLPKPMPGIDGDPAPRNASRTRTSQCAGPGIVDLGHHIVDSAGRAAWLRGSPSMCMSTTPALASRRRRRPCQGRRAGRDVVDDAAPRARASSATSALVVSTESGTATPPCQARRPASTRRSSSSSETGSDPGRVDSPPRSSRFGPVRDQRIGMFERAASE